MKTWNAATPEITDFDSIRNILRSNTYFFILFALTRQLFSWCIFKTMHCWLFGEAERAMLTILKFTFPAKEKLESKRPQDSESGHIE